MQVLTTSGKHWNIDFETDEGYQQLREMYVHLSKKGFFTKSTDAVGETIGQLKKHYPHIDDDTLRMVATHYYNQLEERRKFGEIDEIDVAIQLAKLVIKELNNRWA